MESRDDLNAMIARWRASAAIAPATLDELEGHLRDACDAGIASGLSPTAAFTRALAQLGDTTQLSGEFAKLDSPTHSKTMNRSILHSPRLRRYARHFLIFCAIALPVRVFALAPYRAVGDSLVPEIPKGSRVIAWRLAPQFEPGDIATYREGDHVFLGRVVRVGDDTITMTRADRVERVIARAAVTGRVILNTR
jgi:hypothetical protein